VAACVFGTFSSAAVLFNVAPMLILSVCGIPVIGGALFGSSRFLWLHGIVVAALTSLI
jgi:hypothetical protein